MADRDALLEQTSSANPRALATEHELKLIRSSRFQFKNPSKRENAIALMRELREDPSLKEAAVKREQEIALTDPEVSDFLTLLHMEADRASALDNFLAGGLAEDVIDTIKHFFGDAKDLRICEIGGGDGFLAAALVQAGYSNVDVMEPASEFMTGTGYLETRPEFEAIRLFNDLDAWYADETIYDLIITNACIHHFENPIVASSQIRLKMRDNALWLAFAEYFSEDYEETISQLNKHRHAVLYRLYEWPYSADLYKRMLEAGGFKRTQISAAIPYGRRKLGFGLTAWRSLWWALSKTRLDWLAYFGFVQLIKLFARKQLARTGAQFMAFRARPVEWENVEDGYNRPDRLSTTMLDGWRPVAAEPKTTSTFMLKDN